MTDSRISILCLAATSGSIRYTQHYTERVMDWTTPQENDIEFILCHDSPQIIEEYPEDPRGPACLIWGTTDGGNRVGHLVCGTIPDSRVITAYFPDATEPEKWTSNYRQRIRRRQRR